MKKTKFNYNRQWNNKKIALISILISTSVAMIVIFTKIIPIASMPTFKIAIGGLPIKITGYIFGPWIGAITGVISDLLSFVLLPTFINWPYTLTFAFAGFIPGIIGFLMNKRLRKKDLNFKKENNYDNVNFFITLFIILFSLATITGFVFSGFADFSKSLVKDKWSFYGIVMSGSGSMLIFVILFRFFSKPKTFNAILPIISFSVILDLVNTPLVSYGDYTTLTQNQGEYLTLLTGHTLLTPIKSWANMFIIYFAYKIISPIIFNKTANGWQKTTKEILVPKNIKIKEIEKIKLKNKNKVKK